MTTESAVQRLGSTRISRDRPAGKSPESAPQETPRNGFVGTSSSFYQQHRAPLLWESGPPSLVSRGRPFDIRKTVSGIRYRRRFFSLLSSMRGFSARRISIILPRA